MQRVGAIFRKPFFELLADYVDLTVAIGGKHDNENMVEFSCLKKAKLKRSNINYLLGGKIWADTNWKENLISVNPDVVVITPTPRMISNYALIRYCKKNGIKVVGWGMGEMPGRHFIARNFHSWLQRTLVCKLDAMVCYSTTAQKYYKSVGVKNTFIAHNSVDTNEALEHYNSLKTKGAEDKESISNKYSINTYKKRIIFVGRLIESKMIHKLLEVCSEVENTQVIVVGSGSDCYVNSLKTLARAKELDVIFTGHRSGLELAELFFLSDVFVLPSLGGLAINHAMSYGKPVIVSEGDGTEVDLVRDGFNGFIFSQQDWEDLRSCLIKALSNKTRLIAMGERSRQIIDEEINLNTMVTSYVEAL